MPRGIKHKDVGNELTYPDFHAEDSHALVQGTSFPESPTEGELFYRLDLHEWYIFDGSNWRLLGEGGNVRALNNSSGSIVITAGDNITLSQNLSTITIIGQSAAAGIAGIGAGTQTAESGTVIFSNSHNLTFGMAENSMVTASASFSQSVQDAVASLNSSKGSLLIEGGNLITISNDASTIDVVNLLSSATTVSRVDSENAVGAMASRFALEGHQHAGLWQVSVGGNTAGQSSAGAGSLMVAGGNNITLSLATAAGGETVSIVGGASLGGIGAGTQTATSGTVILSDSNSITFGMSNSSIITASFSQSTHGHSAISGIGAGTQTATSGTIVFSNSNNFTFGMSGSTRVTASFSESIQTQSIVNAVVIGSNTSGATASISSGTMLLAGGNNITLSQNANSITISAGAGAGGGLAGLANSQTTWTSGTVRLSEVANITINSSQDGASQWFKFSCPAPGGGGGATLSDFRPMENIFTSIGTIPQGSLSIRPVLIPFNVTATAMRFAVSQTVATQSNTSSAGQNLSINVAIYTLNASSLSRASSGSAVNFASYQSNATGSITGMKQLTVPINLNITPGQYWIGVAISTATSGQTSLGQTRTLYGNDRMPTAAQAINIGILGSGTATIRHAYPFQGIYTAATSAPPVSISSGQMNVTSASNPVRANFWFEMRNINIW